MCNIAGYVGSQDAAPLLIEMMKRQSGYGGGYYTGLATIHEGKLYYAKVLGDVDRLLETTDAAKLPGRIGILHSRSNSGGDREWAHPFISNDNRLAYVANGSSGQFFDAEKRDRITRGLERDGFRFSSKAQVVGRYPVLSDGSGVHVSEAMCHLVDRHIKAGRTPGEALRCAFLDFPSEIVALAIHTSTPDRILAARYNQPMMLARAEDGMYLATSALAFPEKDFYGLDLLPACSSAEITRDGMTMRGFKSEIPVAQLDAGMYAAAAEILLRALDEKHGEPASPWALMEETKKLWPEGQLAQSAVLAYETMRPLIKAGRVKMVPVPAPGAPEGQAEGITTTKFLLVKE